MKQLIITFLLLLMFNCNAIAETILNVSPGVRYFNYEETGDGGVFLDKETGVVIGIQGHVTQQPKNSRVYASLNFGAFDGRAKYDGHTQSGAELKTHTDETFYHVGLTFGENLSSTTGPHALYTRMDYHIWNRDILETENSLGLFERYQWWELSFGMVTHLIKSTTHNLSLDLSVLRILRPKVKVDLSALGIGEPTINIEDAFGAAMELRYTLHTNKRQRFGLIGKYKTWRFGASDEHRVDIFSITEPNSRTHTADFSFFIEQYF